MPETTEQTLHNSILNTLQQLDIWLDSEEISTTRIVDIGWLENGNPDYTHHQATATKIATAITKIAKENTTAAEQFAMIKGEKFIRCSSKKIYKPKKIEAGIKIKTTNNNYKPILNLLDMIPANAHRGKYWPN